MPAFVVEDGTGKSTATSYVSVEEADDIAFLNIHSTLEWHALSLQAKQNLLMYVSRALDARALWNGSKATTAQALEWPRKEVEDRYGNVVSDASVPYNIRWAVVELAKANIASDKLSVGIPTSVISEVKADSITVKYADATAVAANQFKLPEIVSDLLRGYGTVRNSPKKVTFGKVIRT